MNAELQKNIFEARLRDFVNSLQGYVSTDDGQWSVKGFVDIFRNVYTISTDTKIVSKILEIHLFSKIVEFAMKNGYKIVLADHQNYYPDISFLDAQNEEIKFAVDFKTTYRLPARPHLCNSFTLGSHGRYFEDRRSTKNINSLTVRMRGIFAWALSMIELTVPLLMKHRCML